MLGEVAEERPSAGDPSAADPPAGDEEQLKAVLEAIVYITDEPLSAQQMAARRWSNLSTRSSGCWKN